MLLYITALVFGLYLVQAVLHVS